MGVVKKCLLGIILGFLVILGIFVLWATLPFTVMDEARTALESDVLVVVEKDKDISFTPADGADKGLIFYPGARVNSEAYAVLARKIAEEGYVVILAQMPLDLSFFDINRAGKIMAEHKEISTWVLGGHSMGGAMAAFFAESHREAAEGIIFLGSYPSEDTDLSGRDLAQLSLYGENERVATEEEVLSRKDLAPADADFIRIDGGNHSGFGYYGDQKGDGPAEISREEQQRIAAKEITAFLGRL